MPGGGCGGCRVGGPNAEVGKALGLSSAPQSLDTFLGVLTHSMHLLI